MYSDKVLFVIDMQKDYVGINSRYKYDSVELIAKINERIKLAQKNNDLIIYIKNKKILKNSEHISDFSDGLLVVSDFIFTKEKSSLFSNPSIMQILNNNKIIQAEIIGVDGNCCVASSAADAVKAGFKTIFPCEYIGVLNKERFVKKKQILKDLGVEIIY
ncbi:MAG: isochorismatase family protein [Eubacteriaceae bacterium]